MDLLFRANTVVLERTPVNSSRPRALKRGATLKRKDTWHQEATGLRALEDDCRTFVVDTDGYQVESYVPGGTKLKLSGTSMASPNVANLAAKLIALDLSLTPEQTIALIRKGADKSADGRRNLINP